MARPKSIELREKVLFFHKKGLTNAEIAKELGYRSVSSISYLIKEIGLKSNCDSNIKLKDIMRPEEYVLLVAKIKEKINEVSQRKLQEELNISKQQLKTILKDEKIEIKITEDIKRAKKSALSLEEREKAFAESLHAKDSSKIYYSDFNNIDGTCFIKCLDCGSIYRIHCQKIRANIDYIFCRKCFEKEQEKKQNKKQAEKELKEKTKKGIKYLKTKSKRYIKSKQIKLCICKNCGEVFYGDSLYCSNKCRDRQRQHIKSRRRIERAKDNGEIDIDITLDKLIHRDNNTCYICKQRCDSSDYMYIENIFIAGNMYPSIDHVIPIAKGGTHTWNNIKLAHRICNSIKSDRILERQDI